LKSENFWIKFTEHHFKRDNKFRTHITIGRLKRSKNFKQKGEKESNIEKIQYSKLKEEYRDKLLGYLKVTKIVLKKSILTPKGPIYETLVF